MESSINASAENSAEEAQGRASRTKTFDLFAKKMNSEEPRPA